MSPYDASNHRDAHRLLVVWTYGSGLARLESRCLAGRRVQVFDDENTESVVASDMDYGLYIFKYTGGG